MPRIDYEFLPSAEEILEELVPAAFKARFFKTFLDAAVGEQIARMVAMKSATENADEMIRDISMEYNRARQTQITERTGRDHRRCRRAGVTTQWSSPCHDRNQTDHETTDDGQNNMSTATANNIGQVTQVIGSTFDAEFAEENFCRTSTTP